jgi:hypothetical protein
MKARRTSAGTGMLLAVAMCALMSASALASAPEVGRCVAAEKNAKKEYNGVYSDAGCTKEVPVAERPKKGKYNWLPGFSNGKFTSTGGVGVLTTVSGSSVECSKESSHGEFTQGGNNKEENGVVVHFTGCKSLGQPCTTPGAPTGELVTNELTGAIGWENKSRKKTDLELFPAKSVGSGLFIEFSCLGLVVKVRGHVLVPIKNDKMTKTETLKFVAAKGKQKPEKWEESAEKQILEASFKGGPFEQAGQQITSTIEGEEKLELNAVV